MPDRRGAARCARSSIAAACRAAITSTRPVAAASRRRIHGSSPASRTRFVGRLIETDEALVEELADELDDVAADLVRRAAHRLGHLQVETAAEHRQPVDEAPSPVVEQVVAPADRAAQRLLALGDVAGSDRQQLEVMLEPSQDLIRRQDDPRRGGSMASGIPCRRAAIPATAAHWRS